MSNKMSLNDLKSMYKPVMVVEGNPNKLTKATKKNHIHVVNPSAKPSKGLSSHAQARKDAWKWLKESIERAETGRTQSLVPNESRKPHSFDVNYVIRDEE